MNFKSFIKNLFPRCTGIIVSPKEEWISIKEEKSSFLQLITGFLLPLLLLVAVASVIGSYIPMMGKVIAPEILVVAGLQPVLSMLLSVVISVLAVNAMIGTYGGTPNINRASKLVIYSFVPGIIVAIIVGMVPLFYLLGLFFLYSFYILFLGTPLLLDIPAERQSNFSTLSSTIILVVYLMISFILSSFFGAIQ